jgi:Na+-transporting NADH:ubiquinone oxidoreductase subunit NqrD
MASVAVFFGSLIGAWATFDFWETIPLVPCVLGAGILAALALYVRRRRLLGALLLGLAVTLITFVGTLFITLARWEG